MEFKPGDVLLSAQARGPAGTRGVQDKHDHREEPPASPPAESPARPGSPRPSSAAYTCHHRLPGNSSRPAPGPPDPGGQEWTLIAGGRDCAPSQARHRTCVIGSTAPPGGQTPPTSSGNSAHSKQNRAQAGPETSRFPTRRRHCLFSGDSPPIPEEQHLPWAYRWLRPDMVPPQGCPTQPCLRRAHARRYPLPGRAGGQTHGCVSVCTEASAVASQSGLARREKQSQEGTQVGG